MPENKYQIKKAATRQKAVDWQHGFNDRNDSWEDLANAGAIFEKLGRRYGLLNEFRANGIPC